MLRLLYVKHYERFLCDDWNSIDSDDRNSKWRDYFYYKIGFIVENIYKEAVFK